MKLLFDQNISFRITTYFKDSYQVKQLGLENKTDLEIWEFSKNNNYAIVTFDSDFIDMANLKGCPPKIIWLRFGNSTTKEIIKILKQKEQLIFEFINNEELQELACLEVN